jgi:pyruvate dehydrogenase E1 component alpha subunit
MSVAKPDLLSLLRTMLRIRLCEEALVDPILSGEIKCPVHLATGQEAVAAGVCAALTEDDYVLGTHRSHGHYLAKGGDMKQLVAEIFCRETGCARGRGGSMHVIAPEVGMLGAAPIVAGTISLATGAALAASIRRESRVSVAFFGDGATGEGVLFEALNFAALKQLPILFVCENNLYSTHLRIDECRPSSTIAGIARPFGIAHETVDGNNVLMVLDAADAAVARCRESKGPSFLECKTYRMRGHVGPDDNIQGSHTDIRPPDEVEEWRQRDPIDRFEQYLCEVAAAGEEQLATIRREVEEEVAEALAFARASSFPDPEEVDRYVYT